MPKVRGSARKLEKSWFAVAKLGEPKPGDVMCATEFEPWNGVLNATC